VIDENIEAQAPTTEENLVETEALIDIQKLLPSRTLGIEKFAEEMLQNMANPFSMVQGLFYVKNPNEDLFHCYAQYAYFSEDKPVEFRTGETLPGQAVKNKTVVSLSNIPDQYMTIASGLGKSNPKQLVFVPLKSQDDVVGLIEYASFEPLSEKQFKALEGISKKVADVIVKHLKK
jgi:transcriptional regulator with GAF, ATPase, and Fis domain